MAETPNPTSSLEAPAPAVETPAPADTSGSPLAEAKTPEAPATPAENLYPDKPAEEAKPVEEAKPAEGEEKPAEEAKPLAASDYQLSLPEGVEVAEEAMATFRESAAKAGLKQETAQALLTMHVDQVKATTKAITDEIAGTWKKTIEGWKAEVDKSPEFSGSNKEKSLAIIGRAFDEYGTPEARDAFTATGAGWNPHIVKLFLNMAKALSEGAPVFNGAPPSRAAGTRAERLYGSTN